MTGRDEITICPKAFERYNTANKLTGIANNAASLKGKTLCDMKARVAASTLLHELSHCESVVTAALVTGMLPSS
jgi:hypothetical protein